MMVCARALLFWLLTGLGLAGACTPAARVERFCELGTERPVAESPEGFDDLAVVALSEGALSVWSEPRGLYARRLGADGKPQAAARRLGPRCRGGVATAIAADGPVVVCLSPRPGPNAVPKHDDAGVVVVRTLARDLRPARQWLLSPAGDLSFGVDAVVVDGGLEISWQDASPAGHRVWWARLGEGPAQAVSTPGRMATEPSITVHAGRSLLTWVEHWVQGEGLENRVQIARPGAEPRTLLQVDHVAAMPQLFSLGGRLWSAVRDRRRAGRKAGLYVAPIAEGSGSIADKPGEAVRIGRADGKQRPSLCPCMGGLVAATPRSYGRDYFVGINWYDQALRPGRGEQQFYEDAHAFTGADVACVGDHALILIAERAQQGGAPTLLSAVPYRCRAGRDGR
ncbi:MAG: hypothetical protein OEZ06_20705 [Myxococcales bacterium]|nr:hypothetical protein [Myxococcales bacterium]